jgi:serine/threonine protein phosphatase 1
LRKLNTNQSIHLSHNTKFLPVSINLNKVTNAFIRLLEIDVENSENPGGDHLFFCEVNGLFETFNERRVFVVGDIHGCARAFRTLIKGIELAAGDVIVVLGDAVDRGPETSEVLDLLVELRISRDLIFIRGNHEEMMLDAINEHNIAEWMIHGGYETMLSYRGTFKNIPKEHLLLLESTVDSWEGPTEICVHANLEPNVELRNQRRSWLRWKKLTGNEQPHPSGKRVICGHSGVGYGAPMLKNGWICLDTNACRGGILTALELTSGEIFQARQSGEFRRGFFLNEVESYC